MKLFWLLLLLIPLPELYCILLPALGFHACILYWPKIKSAFVKSFP